MPMQAQPHVPLLFPGGKRYRGLGPALREIFGERLQRIPISAGFTCPTRDGTVGHGGCLFCDAGGAGAEFAQTGLPVREQVAHGIAQALKGRIGAQKFVAYFQAFTNTYAEPERLRALYEAGLSDPRVVALAIGTRPDCLPEAVLDVLEEFSARTFLWVEIGLQSTRNETLRAFGRGHTVEAFVDAAERLRRRGIRFLGHVILGLPGDTAEDMLAGADLLSRAGAWGVKIHNLYVDAHSPLAERYRRGEIPLMDRAEYLDRVVRFLERLDPAIVVHRVLGQAPRNRLLAPRWCLDRDPFLLDLDRLLEERQTHQGARWAAESSTSSEDFPNRPPTP